MYKVFVENYEIMSDDDVVLQIQAGNSQYLSVLLKRYAGLIHKKAAQWCGTDFDCDDFAQECSISLFHAAQTYDFSSAAFSTYANTCIENAVKTVVKKMFKARRIPENLISSLDDVDIKSGDDPEATVIERETVTALFESIKSVLSEFEYSVFMNYIFYFDYDIIAKKLNVSVKSVNNALCRIRHKLRTKLADNR